MSIAALIFRKSRQPEAVLERFRRLVLEHLDTLEEDGRTPHPRHPLRKAVIFAMSKGGKGLPVGTIREWKGRKFVKTAPGKWRPKYDSEGRAAKAAIRAIKRKVAAAKDAQEMMRIILENRDRFSDKDGHPLPFVQDLSDYVSAEQERREVAGKKDGQNKHGAWSGARKDNPAATEVRQFIKDSMSNHQRNKKFKLGLVSEAAQKRIEKATGIDARGIHDIFTDTSSVIHAYVPKHNLDTDDLLLASDIINTATDISLPDSTGECNARMTV